jgi:Mrp family chromosome partitioning ATPase
MSALDRAFIRAYHRPAMSAQVQVAAAAAVAPTTIEAPTASMAVAATAHALPLEKATAVPLSRALADLGNPGCNGGGPIPATTSPACGYPAAPEIGNATTPVTASIGSLLDEAIRPEEPREPATAESNLIVHSLLPEQTVATVSATETSTVATSVQLPPPPARDVTTGSVAAENNWSPLLQVDRVAWPAIHNRLQSAAPTAIAVMTDALQAIGDSGRKLIGLASCIRGEGVTTLLSAAARHLLERGRKIVVVDSHWGNPQLARCLGLLPQIGWEESLTNGLPLQEIVIESLADGLAVLPVRQPPASAITNTTIAASLEILARNYDFVLVDLGTLDEIEEESSPAHDVAARMDALVLVQNVRKTPPHHLSDVRKRLAASKLRYAGTIQNFAAG